MNAAVCVRITADEITVTREGASPPVTLDVARAESSPLPPVANQARDSGSGCFMMVAQGDAILDTRTGLMWSRENVGKGRCTFAAAETACAQLDLAGYTDWRLPTIQELLALVDYERHDPAIDSNAFPSCESAAYWSSSPAAWSPADCAWFVFFYHGYALNDRRNGTAFVRAVRVAAAPAGQ